MATTLAVPEKTGFEIGGYLQQRTENPALVMIEIGHNRWPLAYQQPFEFNGKRAYIGIEAWLREGIQELEELIEEKPDGQNIFYLDQDIGGGPQGDRDTPSDDEPFLSWYEGPFDTETILPDGAGDEIVLSDVFTDPHIGKDRANTEKLLSEVSRLASQNGIAVLRETATPKYSQHIKDEELLAMHGLSVVALIRRADCSPDEWEALEAVYKGSKSKDKDASQSFYLFLSKQ